MANRRKSTYRRASRQKQSPVLTIVLLVVVAALCWAAASYAERSRTASSAADKQAVSRCDLMHPVTNPDLASTAVEYDGISISFNPKLHIPNWVSWELLATELDGDLKRAEAFTQDEAVKGCPTTYDYRGSGYDRGHMAPAADMKWSETAMNQCFMLTNICPQIHALNGGLWKTLEEKCRVWAAADSAIVIISGPVLTLPIDEYIGENNVAVPRQFFKVILSPYANPPRAIGFLMDNAKLSGRLAQYAVSVDSVEALTGHNFFSTLPADVEAAVESQCNFNQWNRLH